MSGPEAWCFLPLNGESLVLQCHFDIGRNGNRLFSNPRHGSIQGTGFRIQFEPQNAKTKITTRRTTLLHRHRPSALADHSSHPCWCSARRSPVHREPGEASSIPDNSAGRPARALDMANDFFALRAVFQKHSQYGLRFLDGNLRLLGRSEFIRVRPLQRQRISPT